MHNYCGDGQGKEREKAKPTAQLSMTGSDRESSGWHTDPDNPMLSPDGQLHDADKRPQQFDVRGWCRLGAREGRSGELEGGLGVRVHPRPGVYMMSGYLRSSDISMRGHSRGMGPCGMPE